MTDKQCVVQYNSILILGATACGKTGLGVDLAHFLEARGIKAEIISADSRQVYKGLNLGSGKDLFEYGDLPYHLIDVADLANEYNVFSFQKDFYYIFSQLKSKNILPLVVGGTGMYLDSVVRGYDFVEVPVNAILRKELEPLSLTDLAERLLSLKNEIHNRTDLDERERLIRAIEIVDYNINHKKSASAPIRPLINPLILGVKFERSVLRSRIKDRLEERIRLGLAEEVQGLYDSGTSWERLERLGLEYRFTSEYLQGKISSEQEWISSLYTAICQFAKRQETWFRGMERKGVSIQWIPDGDREIAHSLVEPFFS